ncbi:flagellar motor protein MotB [Octadecabacter sp. 1_MG-2023]|uniref:flagellar motor protein MotB n=1 Tax=unclassified Octadecabacter TaxID=196158 RepID=UPI001C090A68|nr:MULTISPECIES: flagellar motor protein MotB [unclassified Octadecabacter]MBU2992364.1 chemotaxis protein MotB [Octadecabacter sp. B2R22]MDO6734879.1 flagellar motor protein MotB [Octadecabacter sp. 1_MG-2023]
MAHGSNAPIIIKRKKVIAGGGHHGGAWKVAYADFVTAMMAFFLLMWLLNATTEQQRKGLADYFSPTIPVVRVSGGGDGMFSGSSMMADDAMAQDGTGAVSSVVIEGGLSGGEAAAAEVAALQDIEAQLLGIGGESLVQQEALRHVVTRLTDEGLIIEVFAREGAPLFDNETASPTPVLVELSAMFARVFSIVTNPVAIEGHTRSVPLVVADREVWDISTGRAETVRLLLEAGTLDPTRIARITGHADRDLANEDSLSVRNNRIEITLLRVEN